MFEGGYAMVKEKYQNNCSRHLNHSFERMYSRSTGEGEYVMCCR